MKDNLEEELNECFKITVELDGHVYHAYCPNVRGIHCDGTTKEDAIYATEIACRLYLKSIARHLKPIVEERLGKG